MGLDILIYYKSPLLF